MVDDIKQIFLVFSKYNKITNQDMIKVLESLDSSKLSENVGSYFGSILGILNHHLMADIGWLRALGNHISNLDFMQPLLEKFPSERPPSDQLHWATLDDYKIAREEIDDILERVVTSIPADKYNDILKIVGRRGTLEDLTWRILLHVFNHQTHHRGGVSVLLDQLKVENDYSNLLWKV